MRGFDREPAVGADPAEAVQLVERDARRAGAIGRIEHQQVVSAFRRAEREHRGGPDVGARCRLERAQILAQNIECVAVLFGKQALRGAARQRLDPERARAGEQVGDDQPFEAAEAAGEHREQGLARAVGGGARRVALGRDQPAAAPFARNNPHRHQPRCRRNLNNSSRGTTSTAPIGRPSSSNTP